MWLHLEIKAIDFKGAQLNDLAIVYHEVTLLATGKGVVRTTLEDISENQGNMPVGTQLARIELGQDVDDIHEHFFVSRDYHAPRYRPEEWAEILREVQAEEGQS